MTIERKDGQTLESYTIMALGQDVAALRADNVDLRERLDRAEQRLRECIADRAGLEGQVERWRDDCRTAEEALAAATKGQP